MQRWKSIGLILSATAWIGCRQNVQGPGSVETARDRIEEILSDIQELGRYQDEWLSLLVAAEVVEGTIHAKASALEAIDRYVTLNVSHAKLLRSGAEELELEFSIYKDRETEGGAAATRHGVTSRELMEFNGTRCILFASGCYAIDSRNGAIRPIVPAHVMEASAKEFSAFLRLYRIEHTELGLLVGRHDVRIERIIRKMRESKNNRADMEACLEEMVSLGESGLQGILLCMLRLMSNPEENFKLNVPYVKYGIFRTPGNAIELLQFAVECAAGLGNLGMTGDSVNISFCRALAIHIIHKTHGN